MSKRLFHVPNRKQLRAELVRDFCASAGIAGAVCLSCGNASRALKELETPAFNVVAIAPGGDLMPARWLRADEIRRAFPQHLDATSGHLTIPLMAGLAALFAERLQAPPRGSEWLVETGSGETIVALSMAFPDVRWSPLYTAKPHSLFSPQAPANALVCALAR